MDSIYTLNPNTQDYDLVWTQPASPQPPAVRIMAAVFAETAYPVSGIRLAINSPAVPGWNEIDAVGIGAGGYLHLKTQWASSAVASSEYTPTSWSASQAAGPPNVYPRYGDIPSAWASLTPDGSREWLQLTYAQPESISHVDVFQTYKPGAIDSIYVRNALDGSLQLWYSATPAAGPDSSIILTARQPLTTFPVDGVRLTLASDVVPNWNEIDAVSIGDTDFVILPGITGVPNASEPSRPTRLEPARPNPFRGATAIDFALARPGPVRLAIYDLRGARVALLMDGTLEAGEHALTWKGLDDTGHPVRSGIYFVRLEASGARDVRRIVRLE